MREFFIWKCFAKLLSSYFLAKKQFCMKNTHVKCWWNWPQYKLVPFFCSVKNRCDVRISFDGQKKNHNVLQRTVQPCYQLLPQLNHFSFVLIILYWLLETFYSMFSVWKLLQLCLILFDSDCSKIYFFEIYQRNQIIWIPLTLSIFCIKKKHIFIIFLAFRIFSC